MNNEQNKPLTRVVIFKGFEIEITVNRAPIPIGSTALHAADWYREKHPECEHLLTVCNENNHWSIEEHWRQVISIKQIPSPSNESVEQAAESYAKKTNTPDELVDFDGLLEDVIKDFKAGAYHPATEVMYRKKFAKEKCHVCKDNGGDPARPNEACPWCYKQPTPNTSLEQAAHNFLREKKTGEDIRFDGLYTTLKSLLVEFAITQQKPVALCLLDDEEIKEHSKENGRVNMYAFYAIKGYQEIIRNRMAEGNVVDLKEFLRFVNNETERGNGLYLVNAYESFDGMFDHLLNQYLTEKQSQKQIKKP